jgi:hypothetical protein
VCPLNSVNVTPVRVYSTARVIPVYILDMIELLLPMGLSKYDT